MHPTLTGSATHWIIVLESAFFAVLFLQSASDKLLNWKDNLGFHQSHFATSPLARWGRPMLLLLTMLELIAGGLSVVALLLQWTNPGSPIILCAFYLPALVFLCLFFGQRIAKDYAGAAALVPYFLLALFGILVAG